MAIHHEIVPDGRVLRVRAWGFDESLDDANAYAETVLAGILKNDATHVFCDERELTYRLNLLDTFKLAEHVAKLVPHSLKVAIVTKSENLKDASFYEDVAVSRGMSVRVFYDVEHAWKWLGIPR